MKWATDKGKVSISIKEAETKIKSIERLGLTDLNSKLHCIYNLKTNGKPFSVTQSVRDQNGFEVWRKLGDHYDPQNPTRSKTSLEKIMRTKPTSLKDFVKAIWDLEGWIREYDEPRLTKGLPPLEEESKCTALLGLCTSDLHKHLKMNNNRYQRDDFSALRQIILEYVDTYGPDTGGRRPMNIDAFGKGIKNDKGHKGPWKGSENNGGKNNGGKSFMPYQGKGPYNNCNNGQYNSPTSSGGFQGKGKGKGKRKWKGSGKGGGIYSNVQQGGQGKGGQGGAGQPQGKGDPWEKDLRRSTRSKVIVALAACGGTIVRTVTRGNRQWESIT